MFEDVYVANRHFVGLIESSTLQDVSALERKFLSLLDYKLHVSASEYARFYFAICKMPPLRFDCKDARMRNSSDSHAHLHVHQRRDAFKIQRAERKRKSRISRGTTWFEAASEYFAILLGDAALVGTRTGRVKKTLASVYL
jgi:hypothetical protein